MREPVKMLALGEHVLPEEVARVLKLKWLRPAAEIAQCRPFHPAPFEPSLASQPEPICANLEPYIHDRDDEARHKLAKQFGFTDKAYVSWLSFLYALLSDAVATPSWLERITDLLIRHPNIKIELFQDRQQAYTTDVRGHRFCLTGHINRLGFSLDPHHWLV